MKLTRPVHVLTLDAAKRLAEAAETEALKRGWTIAIAVVDAVGGLILVHVLDGTQPASQEIALLKARTAARLRRSTKVLEDGVAGGRPGLATLPGAITLEGGMPLIENGQVVGAIGISGMSSVQDGVLVTATLAAIANDG
jgi:uncharacterized protein GlcG (DUF336 family)